MNGKAPAGASQVPAGAVLGRFVPIFTRKFKRPFEKPAIFGASFLGNLMLISGKRLKHKRNPEFEVAVCWPTFFCRLQRCKCDIRSRNRNSAFSSKKMRSENWYFVKEKLLVSYS
jgi:hypothetical protein